MIRLRPWSVSDLPLLFRANSTLMTEHLGGPETESQVRTRHQRYLDYWADRSARMFVILADDEPVGGIGWWGIEWRGAPAHETGWFVIPEAQSRGAAAAATRLIVGDAASRGEHRWLTACPAVTNTASNHLCERSGFHLEGETDLPFRGTVLHVNEWALDLNPLRSPPRQAGPLSPRTASPR